MGEIKIPCIFYLYLHSKIYERARGEEVDVKEVKKYLSKWFIPKNIRYLILKELELLGLIKLNRLKMYLERPIFNQQNINRYSEMLGLF